MRLPSRISADASRTTSTRWGILLASVPWIGPYIRRRGIFECSRMTYYSTGKWGRRRLVRDQGGHFLTRAILPGDMSIRFPSIRPNRTSITIILGQPLWTHVRLNHQQHRLQWNAQLHHRKVESIVNSSCDYKIWVQYRKVKNA